MKRFIALLIPLALACGSDASEVVMVEEESTEVQADAVDVVDAEITDAELEELAEFMDHLVLDAPCSTATGSYTVNIYKDDDVWKYECSDQKGS